MQPPLSPPSVNFTLVHLLTLLPTVGCLIAYIYGRRVTAKGVKLPSDNAVGARTGGQPEATSTSSPDNGEPIEEGEDREELDEVRLRGRPIDLQRWSRKYRRSMRVQVILALLLVGLDAATIVLILLSHNKRPPHIIAHACSAVVWLTCALYAAAPALQGSLLSRQFTVFGLASMASMIDLIKVSLLPGARPNEQSTIAVLVQAIDLLFAFTLSCFAGLTRLGPRRAYLDGAGKETGQQVIGFGQDEYASVIERLVFSYVTPLALTASRKGGLDEMDVSGCSFEFRTEVVDKGISTAFMERWLPYRSQQKEAQAQGRQPKRSTLPLLKAIIWHNLGNISITAVTAIVFSCLSYGPMVFLNLFLQSLQRQEQYTEKNVSTPITLTQRIILSGPYCIAILGVRILIAASKSIFNSNAHIRLAATISQQLNILLFSKSLRRKDTTGQSSEGDQGGDESAQPINPPDVTSGKKASEASSEGFVSKSQILTLSTVDVDRVAQLPIELQAIIMTPSELIIGVYFVYHLLGSSAIWGYLLSLVTQPVTFALSRLLTRVQDRMQRARDEKVSMLSEALGAVRMLKFNAWEERIRQRVDVTREKELKQQWLTWLLEGVVGINILFTPALVSLTAFGHYTLVRKQTLTPSTAFTALAVLNELRWTLIRLPESVTAFLRASVSFKRIARYLDGEEVDQTTQTRIPGVADAVHKARPITFVKATVTWPQDTLEAAIASSSQDQTIFALRDLDVTFASNALTLVAGRLGTGKTLLLRSLIGEADVLSGTVVGPRSSPDAIANDRRYPLQTREEREQHWQVPNRAAIVPQVAFLQSATVRDNILFGLEMWPERYEATIFACGLKPDLDEFEDGDLTAIGDNGVGLSGGQKARVSLARAVYSRASVLLLDDVLSAVDAHTAAHIATHLLTGPLCSNRTVIMVSHQVQLVAPLAAQVVVLAEAKVAFTGSSDEFMKSDFYSGLLDEEPEEQIPRNPEVQQEESATTSAESSKPHSSASSINDDRETTSRDSVITESSTATSSADLQPAIHKRLSPDNRDDASRKAPRKMIQEEARAKGAVRLEHYKAYLLAGGSAPFWIVVVLLFSLAGVFPIALSWWLKLWSEDVSKRHPAHETSWYFSRYILLNVGQILAEAIKKLAVYTAAIVASRRLFKVMLHAILRAPLDFHDSSPQGRLLNRLTGDVEKVDSELPMQWEDAFDSSFEIFTSSLAVIIGGGPAALIILAVAAPFFWRVSKAYFVLMRDSRRIRATNKSKIISALTDVISGITVIRGFGAGQYLIRNFYDVYDAYFQINLASVLGMRWMSFRFEIYSGLLFFGASIIIVVNPGASIGLGINAAAAGFLMTSAFNVYSAMLWGLWSYASLEQSLVSVERVIEYCDLPSEKAEIVEPRPAKDWPQHGNIELENLEMRYAPDLPLVLKGISLTIPAGSKVAIVGPTGSGKSTLASCLFRFVEADVGRILIDDVDISTIGLTDLRSRLQIVPQDPIVLSGPLRSTIDLFHEYTDEEILDALRAVSLIRVGDEARSEGNSMNSEGAQGQGQDKRASSTDFSNLSYPITENGSNLSSGQRQLLCLARSILRRSKVIIFDEATSSTDPETEEALSRTIRSVFKHSTVLAIAHRLRSIIDFDAVVVLERGQVVEYGSPRELLSKGKEEGGRFWKLCKATGKAEFRYLREAAEGLGGNRSV